MSNDTSEVLKGGRSDSLIIIHNPVFSNLYQKRKENHKLHWDTEELPHVYSIYKSQISSSPRAV